jgi:uncharacterized protein (TIGR02996 family)
MAKRNALLDAVYANPDDDAARSVYADALQEDGDPRGELIALQLLPTLDGKQAKRVAKLLADRASIARWLGPLAPVVREPVFERGFLHRCRIDGKLIEHPAWSTVRELVLDDLAPIDSPAMKSLRAVWHLPVALARQLAERKTPPALDALGVAFERGFDEVEDAPEHFTWLLDSKLGKRITTLEIDRMDIQTAPTTVHAWSRAMRARATPPRIVLAHGGGHPARRRKAPIVLERVGDAITLGTLFEKVSAAGKYGTEVSGLPHLLEGFPDRAIPAITVRVAATESYLGLVRKTIEKDLRERFETVTFELC